METINKPAQEKPGEGRIVHFYDVMLNGKSSKEVPGNGGLVGLNGQGSGPYPALVLQNFTGPYVNLLVHAWGGDWREGSVEEFDPAKTTQSRYWKWPTKNY